MGDWGIRPLLEGKWEVVLPTTQMLVLDIPLALQTNRACRLSSH